MEPQLISYIEKINNSDFGAIEEKDFYQILVFESNSGDFSK